WLEGFATGRLRYVPSATPEDIGETGPRFEINRAKVGVVRALIRDAGYMEKMNQPEDAARLVTKGFRLARELRNLSPRALAESAQSQKALIGTSVRL
ncbi:hypothetical protein ABTO79_18990, partial [Acinetobacter baumannii]